jgi:CHAT domain-containing protein/Flp pilus assembly protein TadD
MKSKLLVVAAVLAVFALGVVFPQTDAGTWNNMGVQYFNQGNFAKAIECFLQVKSIIERTQGKENLDYVTLVNNLGMSYYNQGNFTKAIESFLQTKIIAEKILGKRHPGYAQILNNLGLLYNNMANFTQAESCFLEARFIYEKAVGTEHPDYATTINNLGFLYNNMGDYAKAETFYNEAKYRWQKILGTEHPNYASALINLGLLYYNMGNYAKSESNYLEARAIQEKSLGKEHPDYALSLIGLGALYFSMGDYAKSERFYLEAKAIMEKSLGKEHPSYATLLNNMGALYQSMGDYAKAERCYIETKAIMEKVYGKEHSSYAISVNNLGLLYFSMDDYAKAERCYLEAKAIGEKFGKESTAYAQAVNNLGLLYFNTNDYAKAESYNLETKAILERTTGKEHPTYATALNNLGLLYFGMNDYAKAENYYLEAKAVWEKAFGKKHPSYALSLENLYCLYLIKKEYPKALAYKQEQIKTNSELVNKNFSFQTELQRNAYWNANSYSFELSYSLSLYNPAPASNILNYDNALFSKGLLLRTTNAVRDAIYASGNRTLIRQFEELGLLRQQINALRQKEESGEAYIQNLETKAETLEKTLAQSSAAFRDFQSDLAVNWQSVRGKLRQGEAAIEFVSFRVYDKKWTGKTQYAALVVKPGMNAPAWVLLCDEEKLQEILEKSTGSNTSRTIRNLYDGNGLELFEAAWKPLERELSGVTTIYYSPSGLLHKIAFNALPVDDSLNTRLADKYNLNLVSSTREVVNLNRNPAATTQISSAVLYGGLDYNADEAAMRRAAQSYKKDTSVPIFVFPEGLTRGGAWRELPATREESLNIQSYLARKRIPATLYQGTMGNEESFKQLDGKKTGLIHLATHGFFLADVERNNDEKERQQKRGALRAAENPLLRSGLLLAGGNHAWTNKPVEGVESGILTAEKIAGMNLLGTKLVVMSACQTGLGDIKNSEGVFGLQRAFKLAGVETLVMSLWEVDDSVTAKLMSVFYQEWLFSGKSRQEAFKEAQRKIHAERPLPFYWAAFVMMD